jgi:Carbohydrate family 9 binding domain-like
MRTTPSLTALLLCGALGLSPLAGCSSRPRPYTAEQKAELERYVGSAETKPSHPLDIKFGDQIALIGYDLDGEPITPGKAFKVTWHFKVLKPVEAGFALFTHLADGVGTDRINADSVGPLRPFFAPSRWEAGTYVRDEQELILPDDWDSDRLAIYLGFWKDERRLAVKGSSDGRDRARALSTSVKTGTGAQRELRASHADAAPTLDGKLDEPLWASAARTSSLVNTISGGAAEPEASVRTAWDAKNLYVAFDVADDYLKSTFTNDDEHLWEQDCVEIMLDPGGDGKDYVEVQVSPANKHFDTKYDSRRVPGPIGHADFSAQMQTGVVAKGTLNDDDKDDGYTVEIAMPWSALGMGGEGQPKVEKGASLRVNFYVLDARAKGQRAVGWSPVRVGDFHIPDRFGTLILD